MPNAADIALDAGFTELLANAGDSVTFRGVSVSAALDWVGQPNTTTTPGIPDLDQEIRVVIEFPAAQVTVQPKRGEIVTIVAGGITWYARITVVRFIGQGWRCDCEAKP